MITEITDQPQYVIVRDVERHRVAIALVPGMLCLIFSIGLRLGCFRDRSNLYGVGSEGRRSVADSARLARLIRHGRWGGGVRSPRVPTVPAASWTATCRWMGEAQGLIIVPWVVASQRGARFEFSCSMCSIISLSDAAVPAFSFG